MTVMRLKEKLKAHCGTSVPAMRLHLKDERGNALAVLADESKKLGFYSPQDGYTLHIQDTDPMSASANGWLEDVSKVQKYEISDDDYNSRENTYRKFKEGKLKEDPNALAVTEIVNQLCKLSPVSSDDISALEEWAKKLGPKEGKKKGK